MELAPLSQAWPSGFTSHATLAIILAIDDDSPFVNLGIQPADVIQAINQQPVTSPEDAIARLKQAAARRDKNVLLLINRDGTNRYLAMSMVNNAKGRIAAIHR